MHHWLKLAERIDTLSAAAGRAMRWAILASVALAAFAALSRKLFSYYSNSWSEAQWVLFGAAFLWCAADVLRVDEHVRVDALSRRFSARARAWIDLAALALVAVPICALMVVLGAEHAWWALRHGERSYMADGLAIWPVRALVPIGFALLGLAAATGVVAAAVISLALISFPAMRRFGYDARVAGGVVAATGTLTQIVPPSLVLIVVAEQLNMSLGDVYAGVLMPAALLIGLYVAWIGCLALARPQWVPAVPAPAGEARRYGSLMALVLAAAVSSALLMRGYPRLLAASGRTSPPAVDEAVIVAVGAALASMFVLAMLDRATGQRWLSPLAVRVATVLVPPLLLVFAVLGSVFLGAATPTESGSLGALAALAIALARQRITRAELTLALQDTARLSCVVMILLFGATVFSLAFHALEGAAWMRRTLGELPGGPTGFLVIVMAAVFVLGMFLDFFELAVILLPILGPVAAHLGIDRVWFAVLMGLNLQTAYLTPPFGFALFYLRGVVPHEDLHEAGGRTVRAGIGTAQIYRGVLPFIAIQVVVMGLVIAFPKLALGLLDTQEPYDPARAERLLQDMQPPRE